MAHSPVPLESSPVDPLRLDWILSELTATDIQDTPLGALRNFLRSRKSVIQREMFDLQECVRKGILPPSRLDRLSAGYEALEDIEMYESSLDTLSFIQNESDSELFVELRRNVNLTFEKSPRDNCRRLFGRWSKDSGGICREPRYQAFLDELKARGTKARYNETLFRIALEIEQARAAGWFLVFSTLTVDDWNLFMFDNHEEEARRYQNWVSSQADAVCRALYGKSRVSGIPRSDYYRNIGFIEAGSESGRWHYHVLQFMKALPLDNFDVNAGSALPVRRDLPFLNRYWKYGRSHHLPVRFGSFDAFGEAGYRWPVQKVGNTYSPVEGTVPDRLCNYLGKYMIKAVDYRKEDKYRWRMRRTKNLGVTVLNKIVENLPVELLEKSLMVNPGNRLKLLGKQIPNSLLRRSLRRRWFSLIDRSAPALLKKITEFVSPRPSLKERWEKLTTLDLITFGSENIGSLEIPNLTNLDISEFQDIIDSTWEREVGRVRVTYSERGSPCGLFRSQVF